MLLCATLSPAQVAPTTVEKIDPKNKNVPVTTEPKKNGDGTVVLNVFEVKAEDDPYRAANSSAGTRYDVPLNELPMQVDVLTTEFMRDIGSTDMRDALAYAGGIQLTAGTGNQSEDQPDNIYIQIRGNSAGLPNKDGFKRSFGTDTVSVGRIDVVKGAAGALYEYGSNGGAISYSTPEPKGQTTYYVRQYVGDHRYYRTELQATGPLLSNNRASYFMGLGYQRGDSILGTGYSPQYAFHEKLIWSPSVVIHLTPQDKLKINFDYQYITRDNLGGSGRASGGLITDNSTFTDANGVIQNYGYTIPGRSNTNQGNRVLVTPDLKSFRFDGPGTYSKQHNYGHTLRIDHIFTRDFQIWAGYNMEMKRIKSRGYTIALRNWNDTTNVPTAIRNDPRFIALLRGPAVNLAGPITPDTAHQVLEIRPNNVQNDGFNFRPMWKSEIYYHLNFLKTDHRLIAGATWQSYKSDTNSPNYAYDYTSALWNNLPADLILSRFRSPTDFTTVKRWDSALFAKYPVPTTSANGYIPFTTSHFIDRVLYANLASSYFGGHLQSIIGFSDVRSDRQGRVYDPASNFLWSGPAPTGNNPDGSPRNPYNAPSGVMRKAPVKHADPSFNVSYIYDEHLTVYLNGSASTDPGSAYSSYDGEGLPMDPPHSQNKEVGTHVTAWKNKIQFDASYFDTEIADTIRAIPLAYQNFPYNPANGSTYTWGFNANTKTSIATKGYDVKLDYIITNEWRLRATFTNQTAKFTQIGDLGTPGSPNLVFLAQQQAVAAQNLNKNVYLGTDPNDNSKHEASGFVRYESKSGILKGFWGLVGVKYSGPRSSQNFTFATVGGVPASTPTLVLTSVPERIVYDLNLGYKVKVGRYRTEIGVNIVNLTNKQEWYSSYWESPRTVRFFAGGTF
jgi:hypothetical protein